MVAELSHLDPEGRPRMVDVSAKPETARVAVAEGFVRFSAGVLERVLAGAVPKGAVIDVARLAGVLGAKRTAELIPLCHPVRLTDVRVDLAAADGQTLRIEATATAVDRTGVEMEALTAVAVAALTVYDMVKAVDRGVEIAAIRLREKAGGKSGTWVRGDGRAPGPS